MSKTKFLIDLARTLFSNLVSLIVSIVMAFVVPKLIGVEEYGYWQIYLFYSSYLGILNFGWPEGILLRYGGKRYGDLPKGTLGAEFRRFFLVQCAISVLVVVAVCLATFDGDARQIAIGVALCIASYVPRAFLWAILQSCSRISEYASMVLWDRVLFVAAVVIELVLRVCDYPYLIAADLLAKYLTLAYAIWALRDLVLPFDRRAEDVALDTRENVKAGLNVTLANVSDMLIVGAVRFGVQMGWSVSTYGMVSLTLSISGFLMTFVRAVSVVLFPTLRQFDDAKRRSLYGKARSALMLIVFALLILYYPVRAFADMWLPQYEEALVYMAILFPMCVFEAKRGMLIDTYLKAYRMERVLLATNLVTVAVSVVSTAVIVIVFHNLTVLVISIVALLAFRSVLGEVMLATRIRLNVAGEIMVEVLLSAWFVVCAYFIGWPFGFVGYLAAFVLYVFCHRDAAKGAFGELKRLRNLTSARGGDGGSDE